MVHGVQRCFCPGSTRCDASTFWKLRRLRDRETKNARRQERYSRCISRTQTKTEQGRERERGWDSRSTASRVLD